MKGRFLTGGFAFTDRGWPRLKEVKPEGQHAPQSEQLRPFEPAGDAVNGHVGSESHRDGHRDHFRYTKRQGQRRRAKCAQENKQGRDK